MGGGGGGGEGAGGEGRRWGCVGDIATIIG